MDHQLPIQPIYDGPVAKFHDFFQTKRINYMEIQKRYPDEPIVIDPISGALGIRPKGTFLYEHITYDDLKDYIELGAVPRKYLEMNATNFREFIEEDSYIYPHPSTDSPYPVELPANFQDTNEPDITAYFICTNEKFCFSFCYLEKFEDGWYVLWAQAKNDKDAVLDIEICREAVLNSQSIYTNPLFRSYTTYCRRLTELEAKAIFTFMPEEHPDSSSTDCNAYINSMKAFYLKNGSWLCGSDLPHIYDLNDILGYAAARGLKQVPQKADNTEINQKKIERIVEKVKVNYTGHQCGFPSEAAYEHKYSGSGPYHEESHLAMVEKQGKYTFILFERAPMVGSFSWVVLNVGKGQIKNNAELELLKKLVAQKLLFD